MCKLCRCDGVVGAVFVLSCGVSYALDFVDNLLLYSLFCASRCILLIEIEDIETKKMRATLACLLTCACIAHVL